MCYRCDFCGVTVPPRQAVRRVVVERRIRHYPSRYKVHRVFVPPEKRIKSNRKWEWIDDPGGQGWEAVKEVSVCGACEKTAQSS